MSELEIMQNAKLMLLHSMKFKALAKALFDCNPALFAAYEAAFREMEETSEELAATNQAIIDLQARQN